MFNIKKIAIVTLLLALGACKNGYVGNKPPVRNMDAEVSRNVQVQNTHVTGTAASTSNANTELHKQLIK